MNSVFILMVVSELHTSIYIYCIHKKFEEKSLTIS